MILGLKAAGLNAAEITRQLGVNRKTVDRWLKRDEEIGSIKDLPRSGRPRITSPNQDRDISLMASRDPFTNATKIRETLAIPVSNSTIRERLKEADLKCRTPATKDVLRPEHKQARMNFATEHVEKDLDFWGRVIFTDEKTFSSTDHGTLLRCWRKNYTS